MLPHEDAAVDEIWPTIRDEYNRSERMHDAFVAAFFGAGKITVTKRRGIRPMVLRTVLGLLTKALKTYRAVELSAKHGLGEDALTLTRSLFETAIVSMFILRRTSRRRTAMYHGYLAEQNLRMLKGWRDTKGLKRLVRKETLAEAQALRDRWYQKLPPGTNVYRHWSGERSLEKGIKLIPGGEKAYEVSYRHLSPFAHASDFNSHVEIDEAGQATFNAVPDSNHVKAASSFSHLFLWLMVDGINGRLGLGLEETLELHRPEGVKKPAAKRTRTP